MSPTGSSTSTTRTGRCRSGSTPSARAFGRRRTPCRRCWSIRSKTCRPTSRARSSTHARERTLSSWAPTRASTSTVVATRCSPSVVAASPRSWCSARDRRAATSTTNRTANGCIWRTGSRRSAPARTRALRSRPASALRPPPTWRTRPSAATASRSGNRARLSQGGRSGSQCGLFSHGGASRARARRSSWGSAGCRAIGRMGGKAGSTLTNNISDRNALSARREALMLWFRPTLLVLPFVLPPAHAQAPPDRGPVAAEVGTALPDGAIARDGRLLASLGSENDFRLWDAATGVETRWLQKQVDSPRRSDRLEILLQGRGGSDQQTTAFSPDGKVLAVSEPPGIVRLWGIVADREVKRFQVKEQGIHAVVFSPNGKQLAAGGASEQGTVHVWDVASGKEVWQLQSPRNRPVKQFAFAPDGRYLVGSSLN